MDSMPQTNGGVIGRPRSVPFEPTGKVLSLEIILDRRDGPSGIGVYWPSDLLTGHVRLDLAQRLTVNNIDLLVQGTGNVAWREGGQIVTDDEVYLNDIAELVSKRSNEMVTLSPGEHIFPFACDLPGELPATFTGSHGNVSYLVKVVIQADRNEPVHREPCIATCLFLLESRLSAEGLTDQLNSFRIDYKHPVKASGLSTGSSAVKVSLFLPRRAYDIGDSIVVNMSLTNTSKRAVKCMSLGLVMETTYRAQERTTTERLLVVDHEDEFVVRHLENRNWRHIGLNVPRCIPPSGLPNSTLMSVKYWLVFKAELDRTQESVMIQTPVLIGLELPDEMKLTPPAMDGSFTDGARTMDDTASGRQSSPHILYKGSREPSLPANPQPQSPTSSAAMQRPLYIEVRKSEQRPSLQLPPQHPPQHSSQLPPRQPQLQPPYSSATRVESDSQVISMRFADELDDHSPYGQPYHLQPQLPQQPELHHHPSKVSRNPLFVPENGANGHHDGAEPARRFDGGGQDRGDRMLTALGASLDNGVEEVLY